MKNFAFCFSLFFVMINCGCNSDKKKNDSNEHHKELKKEYNLQPNVIGDYSIYQDSIYFNQKNDTNFSYKFNADSSELFMLSSIIVYKGNNIIQKIEANKSIDLKEFRLIDWNFDGYRDISVLRECVTSGKSYWIWLYNPKKSNYVYSQELSDIWGLDQDTASKFIIQHFRSGASEEMWDTLKFVGGELVFVKSLYQQRYTDSNGQQWKKQTRHFNKNNKWVEVVDSVIEK